MHFEPSSLQSNGAQRKRLGEKYPPGPTSWRRRRQQARGKRRRGRGTMFTGGYDASSLIQYNRRASGICGAILAPVAIIFMIYALLTYMW